MIKMTSKKIVLKQLFGGKPTKENFKIIEENIPKLKNGEFLVQAEYISVDPLVLYSVTENIGKCIIGDQIAKIIESKNDKYPVGKSILSELGWRNLTVMDASPRGVLRQAVPKILDNFETIPKSFALGALGMPGITGLFGFLNVCKPEKGNTVAISAAAGAVGTHVGQIAKIKGCHVVGITGSDEKGQKLIDDCGFDAYVNYKSENFKQQLSKATPNKIDCYFDNVGGEISSIVLNQMNKFGRVAICGAISMVNNNGEPQKASEVQTPVKVNHIRMEGFHFNRWDEQWEEGIKQNLNWIKEAKLKQFDTITNGFENTVDAFLGMCSGHNFGKTIVQCKE